jgi:hypothetical protein
MLDSLPENFRTGLNKSTSFEARINQALEQALYRSGVSYLVHATSDTSANVSVRLHAFYFGLLLVSRSGNTLGAAEQAHAIDTLVQLHEKRNTQDDKTVIAAIKAFAHDQQSLAMHQHLFKAPEVWSMAEYDAPHMVLVRIAQALGDNCHIKLYDTPLVYLTTYFKENAHA